MRTQLLAKPGPTEADRPDQVRDRVTPRFRLGHRHHQNAPPGPALHGTARSRVWICGTCPTRELADRICAASPHAVATSQIVLRPACERRVNSGRPPCGQPPTVNYTTYI